MKTPGFPGASYCGETMFTIRRKSDGMLMQKDSKRGNVKWTPEREEAKWYGKGAYAHNWLTGELLTVGGYDRGQLPREDHEVVTTARDLRLCPPGGRKYLR